MKWKKVFEEGQSKARLLLVTEDGKWLATVLCFNDYYTFKSRWFAFPSFPLPEAIQIYQEEGKPEGFYSNSETAKKAAYMHVLQQLAIEEATEKIYESITLNTPLTELGVTINVQKLKNS